MLWVYWARGGWGAKWDTFLPAMWKGEVGAASVPRVCPGFSCLLISLLSRSL